MGNLNQENLHYSFRKILARHEKLYRDNTLNLIIRVSELKQRVRVLELALGQASSEKSH